MSDILDDFGSMVFNKVVMKELLPQDAFKSLMATIEKGTSIDDKYLDVIANAMKEWAISKGATHYTHWFQPMIGRCAEKHDSFISKTSKGKVILKFSGEELIKGEPDASSFPSGGLRTTFEARGYTAWDPSSYAFVKDKVLYIPTAFYSFSGDMLDKKAPLLKSMELINKQALRILRLFKDNYTNRVLPTVGAEQEYFLIDREVYKKRPDLYFCKRTLFGELSLKSKELENHYLATVDRRVSNFMMALDEKLWRLGIPAKTKHNEVAPAQYELAPIYTSANLSSDQNLLTMEIMRTTAREHDFECIFHEKPFKGLSGSGKHNNWSLITNKGENLLTPGSTRLENMRFLVFLCAVIKAVDEHQGLLRASVSTLGNDYRLGGNEAPPALISVYLGDEIQEFLESFENKNTYNLREESIFKMNVSILPKFSKDNTDRNRTSPFAFTGNKFEFRMVGASASISDTNTILNVIVADVLKDFADELEISTDFEFSLKKILRETIKKHKRIIFNGDNYSFEWKEEAFKRGLLNLESSAQAFPYFISEKSINLFTRNKIYTEKEIRSRYIAKIENYCKMVMAEVKVLLEMCKKSILPAVLEYKKSLLSILVSAQNKNLEVNLFIEKNLLKEVSGVLLDFYNELESLEDIYRKINYDDKFFLLNYCNEFVKPKLEDLRDKINLLEKILPKDLWPYPTYSDILYNVGKKRIV